MLKFKNGHAYREWRAHWRRSMAITVNEIRLLKTTMRSREVPNGSWRWTSCQSQLQAVKQHARSLQMARWAVEEAHKLTHNQRGANDT